MGNQITITSGQLQAFDINQNQTLEGNEILTAPAHRLALQIEHLQGFEFQRALQTFATLPLEKRAQIFENASDFSMWKKEFAKLSKSSPTEALEIILQMRELSFQGLIEYERTPGMMGAVYLGSLPESLRDKLIALLIKEDPHYYQEMLSIDAKTLSQFERTQKFVGLARSDTNAALQFLQRQSDGYELFTQAQMQLSRAEVTALHITHPGFLGTLRGDHNATYRPNFNNPNIPQQIDGRYEFGLDTPQAQTIYFDQRQYALSSSTSERYLQTAGLAGCSVLILWDAKNKIAAMAHLDGSQDIEDSIDLILGDMVHNGADRSHISAQLMGAAHTGMGLWPERTATLIQQHITDLNIPMTRQDILDDVSIQKQGVSFDIETGSAIYYNETDSKVQPADAGHSNLILRHPNSWGNPPYREQK